ncbi:TPA: hypothetical protein ACNOH8_001512 [Klebsiella aerogenes]
MNNENELTAALLTIEKCRELSGCPAGVDLQDWVKQLAEENAFILQLMHEQAGCFNSALIEGFHDLVMESGSEGLIDVYQRRLQPAIQCVPPTPATDRIVAEAEARGIEKGIAHLENKFSNIGVQIMNLQWLADSLREGAGK